MPIYEYLCTLCLEHGVTDMHAKLDDPKEQHLGCLICTAKKVGKDNIDHEQLKVTMHKRMISKGTNFRMNFRRII